MNPTTLKTRISGIILHPTSLPGPYGIGDFGGTAYRWIDGLYHARQSLWQILPLNPTGYGNSPYQSFASFAGNYYLVSPDLLVEDGLLDRSDIPAVDFPGDYVDYGPVIDFKINILNRAWERFQGGHAGHLRADFEGFIGKHQHWVDDYALFRALKDANGGKAWYEWSEDLVLREPASLEKARHDLGDQVGYFKFVQFLFFRQWQNVKNYANERGIRIFGDVPIFVAGDSADVWANPRMFQLDEQRRPRTVAGVPPDYFSATGQLWGNPVYEWSEHQATNFRWWIERLKATFEVVDLVRIDHFRGFEAYWAIPAGMPTAEVGEWVKAPGMELFTEIEKAFGELPIIAEDLGVITPEVDALRHQFGLPGMKVLQFAFGGGSDNKDLPHNYEHNTVVYTGTHDNDTTCGWYDVANEREKDHVRRYLGVSGDDISWDLIRAAWASVGDTAVAPLQDVLSLGTEARMNFPGKPDGNWEWRFTEEMLSYDRLDRLAELTELYSRGPTE
ncbi:MAG: 4-alpha-glucanotransferase [Gemmataceae bacterium]